MANKKYEEADIQAIADTIREKTGSEESFKVRDMANGVNDVYEVGKKAGKKELMEGAAYEKAYAFFGASWNANTFYPTRDFLAAEYTFQRHNWYLATPAYDLAQRLEECGVRITRLYPHETFYYAHITRLPVLDSSAYPTVVFRYTFREAIFLHTIEKIILAEENTMTFNRAFDGCSTLKNVAFEGTIGASINFSACPLTVASLKSIITHLKDYSGTESEFAYSLTLSSACITALDAEGATSPNSNTWREYATDLGWNIN